MYLHCMSLVLDFLCKYVIINVPNNKFGKTSRNSPASNLGQVGVEKQVGIAQPVSGN